MKTSSTSPKLPEELRANYRKHAHKNSPVVEGLKVAAALKLWSDRGFRDIKFDVPLPCGGKTVFVKVLARNAEGVMFGVECASAVRLGKLREQVERLRACLPSDSYVIVVFPQTADEKAKKAVALTDEVWVTGKNGTVAQMMFSSVFQKE